MNFTTRVCLVMKNFVQNLEIICNALECLSENLFPKKWRNRKIPPKKTSMIKFG